MKFSSLPFQTGIYGTVAEHMGPGARLPKGETCFLCFIGGWLRANYLISAPQFSFLYNGL